MGILLFLLFGLVAGLIARALMPGNQSMGIIATALLGAAGSFVGGFLMNLANGYPFFEFHATGLIGAVVGALILLFLSGVANRRFSHAS